MARPRARRQRNSTYRRILTRLSGPGATFFFIAGLFLATGVYGAVKGGHYDALVAEKGEPTDILARALGLRIKAVTIAGQSELSEGEILSAAGIGPRNSLPFLDVASVRERLKKIPLIKEVAVTKFYPDRLLIEVEERQPSARGRAMANCMSSPPTARRSTRCATGASPIFRSSSATAPMRGLANIWRCSTPPATCATNPCRCAGFRPPLEFEDDRRRRRAAAGDKPRAAVASLVRLQRGARILDKAVLSIDLRQPGRMIARLTDDAAAARAELTARNPKAKGGQT